ncbi:DNA topoisomerase 2-associated protein PAT1 [Nakaseomyces glabratus]|nr:DNA topoisomerase 2-associated protein PAT1 [Nakaseomyces glabratus]KTB15701.1 DNA topoisomerase 2-associated protein PAT1 [Nakaseomyces glabratus]
MSQRRRESALNFEETYNGFGEHELEENDYLNDETFGADIEVGTDFDFGHPGKAATNNNVPAQASVMPQRSYVTAASSGINKPGQQNVDASMDLKPMESLWGGQTEARPEEPVLSMEEIERQQRQMQQQQHQGPHGPMPPMPMMPPNMPPPNMAMPPPGYGPMPGYQYPMNVNPSMFQGPPPPNLAMPPMQPGQGGQPMQPGQGGQPMQQPQRMPMPHQPEPPVQSPMSAVQQSSGVSTPQQSVISSSASPANSNQAALHQEQGQQNLAFQQDEQSQQHQQQQQYYQRNRFNNQNNNRGNQRREPLSPEEKMRLQIRHAKVEKILKHAGLMTPRDKDFITRYQLSQIVTEDPYNEDFYFQVYKLIQRGGVAAESNKGLIARAYLEHSGHRLGGRYKRADIALQRMQSQVEKAVTVAKERPQKNKDVDSVREGVLGKISTTMNSKAPRRQLAIPSHKSNEDIAFSDDGKLSRDSTPALEEVTRNLDSVDLNAHSRTRRRSSYAFSSIDHNSVLSRSGGRKFVLSLIETVYEEVLDLEANLRNDKETDSTALWETLHIDDEVYEVCPFISMLSFDKGVKIIPRIFNFLSKQQKLKLLQKFFSELSHLNIIILSSYKTNPDPTESQLKKMDLFQTVFLKIIVSFLSSSSSFIEIMGLLLYLIKNNNVSFISTSKIGLNLITVLISRAALIRQDSNRSNVLSSPEISTWNEIYDKLFTALESKLSAVFPPKEYCDKVVKIQTANAGLSLAANPVSNKFYDQAYIWQFLASLALSGKLNHQRIIIDEVRDEIFGTINTAEQLKKLPTEDQNGSLYRREKLYQDLNLFLNVMGLVSRDGEIMELK